MLAIINNSQNFLYTYAILLLVVLGLLATHFQMFIQQIVTLYHNSIQENHSHISSKLYNNTTNLYMWQYRVENIAY